MSLNLELRQNQTMSQRMIQSVKILQMTAQDLHSYVEDLALENPSMDIKEKKSESIEDHEWQYSYKEEHSYLHLRQNNDDDYDPKDSWNFKTDQADTLYDYLWSQLITRSFTHLESEILDYILNNLDERGYLVETAEHIAAHYHTSTEHAEQMIQIVQELEPAGICARDLSECLELQLQNRGLLTPVLQALIHSNLELIAKNKLPAISRNLGIDLKEAEKACQLIRSLNPKPGSAFYEHEDMKYIIPDVVVVKFDGYFNILLNDTSYPDISVNSYYQKLCAETADTEVKEYLSQKIKQTEWIKQCIAQRSKTLLNVSREIFKHQEDFFLYGPDHLHPLKMSDIAKVLDIHDSTVSRTIDQKYLQCSWGVYPLAFFFKRNVSRKKQSCSIASVTQAAERTSDDIKKLLREIISAENPKKPYSDRILSELLADKGVTISRRTVAKYRDEENIPDTSGRKKL